MRALYCLFVFVLAIAVANAASAGVVLVGGGLVLAEQSGAFDLDNLAPGGSAFALDIEGQDAGTPLGHNQPTGYGGIHTTVGVNNEVYGNTGAWLAGPVDSFVGINLGAAPVTLGSIAFGRDNFGAWPGNRVFGLFTLQYTQVANPDNTTVDWTDIGTLDYQSPGGPGFDQPSLRHRYNFDPVDATGIRIVTGTSGTAIDEIELYALPGEVFEYLPIVITPESGFSITYDGNEGDWFDPEAPPVQVGAPDNAALAANGATAFGSSEYGAGVHLIANVNDGYYGNSNSWLGTLDGLDPEPFIGIDFAGSDPLPIESIAFGRDNGNTTWNGFDRWAGLYTLQYTLLADPDALTEFTGDPADGWADIGTINLFRQGVEGEDLQEPWLRHLFDLSAEGKGPIMATGIRILTPYGNAIDELEINPIAVPEPSTVILLAIGGLSLILCGLRSRRA